MGHFSHTNTFLAGISNVNSIKLRYKKKYKTMKTSLTMKKKISEQDEGYIHII